MIQTKTLLESKHFSDPRSKKPNLVLQEYPWKANWNFSIITRKHKTCQQKPTNHSNCLIFSEKNDITELYGCHKMRRPKTM